MSEMMLARPYTNMPLALRRGLGDPISDAANALLSPLTQQMNAKIDVAKVEIMSEVQKQGREAKIVALAGGVAAGLLGAFLYNRFLR